MSVDEAARSYLRVRGHYWVFFWITVLNNKKKARAAAHARTDEFKKFDPREDMIILLMPEWYFAAKDDIDAEEAVRKARRQLSIARAIRRLLP
jgi:hypothetical protein